MARENDLDIDSFDIHVRELGFRLFVAFSQSAPEGSVPRFRVHQWPVTILLLQVLPKALIGFSDMTIRVNDGEVFHVGISSVLFLFLTDSRRTIEKIDKATLVQFAYETRSSTLTSAIRGFWIFVSRCTLRSPSIAV